METCTGQWRCTDHELETCARDLGLADHQLKTWPRDLGPTDNQLETWARGLIIGYVVVVVFFTLTDRASTIPSNIRGCQSGTWSQRGIKVNGSHHGDNPLLRPTGIQIATKSYATLQAIAPTNNKTVNQTSFTPYREQPRSTRIVVAYPRPAFSATNRANTFQRVLINNSSQVYQGHTSYKNKEN